MAALVAALSVLLMRRDRTYVVQQVRADALETAARFTERYQDIVQATERLGEQWINRAGMTRTEWVVEAEATLRDVPGLEKIAWADSLGTLQFGAPSAEWSSVPRQFTALGRGDSIAAGDRPRRSWIMPRIHGGGRDDAGVIVPLCYLRHCDGYMVGTFHPDSLLAHVRNAIPSGYHVEVHRGSGSATDSENERSPLSAEVTVGAPNLQWNLVQTPSPALISSLRSGLPFVVLASGLLAALLLGLALWFAGVSDQHRRGAEASRALVAESERRFRAIFDSAFQFVWLVDPDGGVLAANNTAKATIPSIGDLSEVPLWKSAWFAQPEPAARLREAIRRATRGQVIRYEETLAGIPPGNLIVDLSVKPIRDSEGQVRQVLCEGRDITDRRHAENAIMELEALSSMGRMAARVAHEINNPLAGIRNAFLLLKDAVSKDHPHHRFVGAIEREIDRIAGVTRQLYETYRPDQERQSACAVGTVLADVAALLHQVNRDLDVTITVDAENLPGTIQIPEAVVRQVSYNLIQNAAEASGLGGMVRVRGRVLPEGIFEMAVEDSGPGVSSELRERIFEPFYSTKAGLTTGGMGLGLALVKRSIEALGGTIAVGSGSQGGAIFTVQIPVRPDPAGVGVDT